MCCGLGRYARSSPCYGKAALAGENGVLARPGNSSSMKLRSAVEKGLHLCPQQETRWHGNPLDASLGHKDAAMSIARME